MIFVKDETYGLETTIKHLQQYIDANITWLGDNYIYGLIYKNSSDKGIIPEAYIGDGITKKVYAKVFCQDNITSTIGFLESGDRNLSGGRNVNVDAIVTIRLDKAFDSNIRNDELAMLQFERLLKGFYGINEVLTSKQGIENVFSGFYYDNMLYRDMHPWLTFSMQINLLYNDDLKCNTLSVN